MAEIASTFSLFTKITLMVVSSDVVNGACQPASREYQMHQGNVLVFYPSPIQDNVLKDTIYQKRQASSDVLCAVHCLQDDSCKSFNYCDDNVCQLKTANYSVKGSEVQTSAGCRHYGDEELHTEALSTAQTPCHRNYTTEPGGIQVEEPLDIPMRLEFSVQDPDTRRAWVSFSPGTKGFQHVTFSVGLTSSTFAIYKVPEFELISSNTQHSPFFGKPLFVTYNNGHIEAGVKGVETSRITYDLPSPPNANQMFIMLWCIERTEWSFFEPCTPFTLTYHPLPLD